MPRHPLSPQLLNLLRQGMSALQQGRWEEAEVAWRRLLTEQPEFAELQNDYGNLLLNLGRPVEAEAALRKSVSLNPGYAPGWCNLGNALAALERRHEACDAYEKALALDSGLAAARYNLGMSQLALEKFQEGWFNYEARWDSEMAAQRRPSPGRRWTGETPAAGDSLFVTAEQGLGDALQFCRFVPLALQAGFGRVVLEAPAPLLSLLRHSLESPGGGISVVAKGSGGEDCTWHCPMMSLPLALRAGVDKPLPASVPYLSPSSQARERWASRLRTGGLRAGLVWSCNLRHRRGLVRVMGAAPMAQAMEGWPGSGFGLVKEERPEDRAASSRWTQLGPQLADFEDTAAVLELMDVVITVDTSVAHLAGALGRRTFIVLPFGADWRWFERRSESPWYPTATLFRQSRPGDWGGVAAEVREALATLGKS